MPTRPTLPPIPQHTFGRLPDSGRHVTRVNQGLLSTTMEAEKRDPGNEVGLAFLINARLLARLLVFFMDDNSGIVGKNLSTPLQAY